MLSAQQQVVFVPEACILRPQKHCVCRAEQDSSAVLQCVAAETDSSSADGDSPRADDRPGPSPSQPQLCRLHQALERQGLMQSNLMSSCLTAGGCVRSRCLGGRRSCRRRLSHRGGCRGRGGGCRGRQRPALPVKRSSTCCDLVSTLLDSWTLFCC